ncbi:MAG: PorT family protein [Tannerella sp.]|jgi:hypothetical protein|nr:PorT family protein [Tannerella sp.]
MYRYIYLFILLSLGVLSNAQPSARFGVKGGVSVASATFNTDVFRSDNITGYHLGPVIEAMMGRGGLGLDAAILFSRKGFDTDGVTVSNSYLEVPVNLKFKLGTPLINPYIAVGPYIDFLIGGDKNWELHRKAENILSQIKTQSFGAGLSFALGADLLNHLQLTFNYNFSLTDNYKTFDANDLDSYKGRNYICALSAAYFF